VKNDEGQQKIKIVRTNRQSNLRGSCQSIFSLSRHHPNKSLSTDKERWCCPFCLTTLPSSLYLGWLLQLLMSLCAFELSPSQLFL